MDDEFPFFCEYESPAFVHTFVVDDAQRDEIVEVGWSAVFPFDDVMHLAVIELDVAQRTGGVHDPECGPLGVGGGAV